MTRREKHICNYIEEGVRKKWQGYSCFAKGQIMTSPSRWTLRPANASLRKKVFLATTKSPICCPKTGVREWAAFYVREAKKNGSRFVASGSAFRSEIPGENALVFHAHFESTNLRRLLVSHICGLVSRSFILSRPAL